MARTRSTSPVAVRSATDADGDTIGATRLGDGSVYVRVATDGGDSFVSVHLTAEQWAAVRAL